LRIVKIHRIVGSKEVEQFNLAESSIVKL